MSRLQRKSKATFRPWIESLEDRCVPANHAPIGAAATLTIPQTQPYVFQTADFGFTDPNDSPANTLLAVEFTTLPNGGILNNGLPVAMGTFVSAADIIAGYVSYTPFIGGQVASFTFQVQDNGGIADGGVDTDPTPRTMTLQTDYVNQAPSFTASDPPAVEQGAAPVSIPNWVTSFYSGAFNETWQTATYYVTNVSNPDLFSILPAVSPDRTLTYTLAASGTGTSTFDVRVQDNGGTANGGQDTSPVSTYSITAGMGPAAPRVDITAYRPQTVPFRQTRVAEGSGVGIRSNGDDDNHNSVPDWNDAEVEGDDDLIEIALDFGAAQPPPGVVYFLKRSNDYIKVWNSAYKGGSVLGANDEQQIPFAAELSLWVEWVNPTFQPLDATLTFEARDAQTSAVVGTPDSVYMFRFTSVVIAIGGNTQVPSDPPQADEGTFVIARQLYADEGYDVHMYAQTAINNGNANAANRGLGAAYDEVVNAVNNRNVQQISVFGFSWGGGATFNLVERLVADRAAGIIQQVIAFPYTAYIDAIQQGSAAPPQTNRPPTSQYHVNYFQRRDFFIAGNAVPGSDFELDVNTTNWGEMLVHTAIDDDVDGAGRNVLEGVRNRLIQFVNR